MNKFKQLLVFDNLGDGLFNKFSCLTKKNLVCNLHIISGIFEQYADAFYELLYLIAAAAIEFAGLLLSLIVWVFWTHASLPT